MPVEIEYKYVLTAPYDELFKQLELHYTSNHIQQIYTDKGNRFRHTRKIADGWESNRYQHTYKKKVGGRVLEIESEITAEDFRLVKDNLEIQEFNSVSKVRFKVPDGDTNWDIDFLLTAPLVDHGHVYFALAEAEVPREGVPPMLGILAPYIRLAVPLEHTNWFSNYKLSNQGYAATAIEDYLKFVGSGNV